MNVQANEQLSMIEDYTLEDLVKRIYSERSRLDIGDFNLTHMLEGYWDRQDVETDNDSFKDELPAGDFRFSRLVHAFLMEREGIAPIALRSTGSQADALRAQESGFDTVGPWSSAVMLPCRMAARTGRIPHLHCFLTIDGHDFPSFSANCWKRNKCHDGRGRRPVNRKN